MKTRILFIDEDPEQLRNYQEILEPKSALWEAICVDSSEGALTTARSKQPDIILASYALDGGRGAEVLAELERLLPNAQRFITATDAEKPELAELIGGTFQFLPSPCPANRLITEIQRSLAIDTWLGNPRIKEIVAKMGEFPSLPPMYLKVVNALNSRSASAADVSQAISGDLAISAKVLQTVNSSYYGFEEKISDITQAVSILGIECIKNLVLAVQVFNNLGRSAEQKAITDQLWHHSMSVAVAAKRITSYESGDEKAAEEAYTAGLMHDLGKLVLLNAVPKLYHEARSLSRDESLPLWEIETKLIGCNHAETGAYLLARWGMPASVVEAVALHHEPVNSFGKRFSALSAVHVANALVWERHSVDNPDSRPDLRFLAEIGQSDSWSTWQSVVSGKAPAKQQDAPKQKDSSVSKSSATPSRKPKRNFPKRTIEPPDSQEKSEDDGQKRSASALAPIGLALVAGLALALGFYFFSGAKAEAETAPLRAGSTAESAKLAKSFEEANAIAGTSQSERAIEEVFDPIETLPDSRKASTPVEGFQPTGESAENADAPAQAGMPASEPEPLASPETHVPESAFPEIRLAGIFFNSDTPLASVNGKIRRIGDSVAGAKIVRIEQRRIVVRYEDEVRVFQLK